MHAFASVPSTASPPPCPSAATSTRTAAPPTTVSTDSSSSKHRRTDLSTVASRSALESDACSTPCTCPRPEGARPLPTVSGCPWPPSYSLSMEATAQGRLCSDRHTVPHPSLSASQPQPLPQVGQGGGGSSSSSTLLRRRTRREGLASARGRYLLAKTTPSRPCKIPQTCSGRAQAARTGGARVALRARPLPARGRAGCHTHTRHLSSTLARHAARCTRAQRGTQRHKGAGTRRRRLHRHPEAQTLQHKTEGLDASSQALFLEARR